MHAYDRYYSYYNIAYSETKEIDLIDAVCAFYFLFSSAAIVHKYGANTYNLSKRKRRRGG